MKALPLRNPLIALSWPFSHCLLPPRSSLGHPPALTTPQWLTLHPGFYTSPSFCTLLLHCTWICPPALLILAFCKPEFWIGFLCPFLGLLRGILEEGWSFLCKHSHPYFCKKSTKCVSKPLCLLKWASHKKTHIICSLWYATSVTQNVYTHTHAHTHTLNSTREISILGK